MSDAASRAFKRGFIEHCKQAGLSLDDMHAVVDFALQADNAALEKTGLLGTGLLRRFAPALAARLGPYAGALRSGLGRIGDRLGPVVRPLGTAAGGAALYAAGTAGESARQFAAGAAGNAPNIYMQALPYMIGLGGAAGLTLGSGIGTGLAALDDDAETPEQIKAKELAQTYKMYAEQIRAKKQYQLSRQ